MTTKNIPPIKQAVHAKSQSSTHSLVLSHQLTKWKIMKQILEASARQAGKTKTTHTKQSHNPL